LGIEDFLRQRVDAEGVDAAPVDDGGDFDDDIVGDTCQGAVVGHVHLILALIVVDQAVDYGDLLLVGFFGSKGLDEAGGGVAGQFGHLGDAFFQIFDEVGSGEVCVGSAPGLGEPPHFGIDIGMVPPGAAAGCVTDGHQAVHTVHMDGAAAHLNVVGTFGDVGFPVIFAFFCDPFFENRIGVFAFVVEVGEPDVVIEAGRLPGDISHVGQSEGSGDLIDAVVAMAEAADLDAGGAGHECAALVDGIAGLDEPGIGADVLHIAGHAEHEVEVDEVALPHTAAVIVAVPVHQLAPVALFLVAAGGGGVYDEIGVLEGIAAVGGAFEAEVGAKFTGVAYAELMDHIEPVGVDIHEGDEAAAERICKADVFNKTERELGAAGADDGQLDWGGHRDSL